MALGSEGFGHRGLVVHHVAVGDGDALRVTRRPGRVLKERDGVGGEVRHRPRVRIGERRIIGGHALQRALEIESLDTRGEQVAQLLGGQCQAAVRVAKYPGDALHAPLIEGQRRGHGDDSGIEAAEERPPEIDSRLEQEQHRPLGLRSCAQPSGDLARITVEVAETRHFGDEMSSGLVQERETAGIGVNLELRPQVRHKVVLADAGVVVGHGHVLLMGHAMVGAGNGRPCATPRLDGTGPAAATLSKPVL